MGKTHTDVHALSRLISNAVLLPQEYREALSELLPRLDAAACGRLAAILRREDEVLLALVRRAIDRAAETGDVQFLQQIHARLSRASRRLSQLDEHIERDEGLEDVKHSIENIP